MTNVKWWQYLTWPFGSGELKKNILNVYMYDFFDLKHIYDNNFTAIGNISQKSMLFKTLLLHLIIKIWNSPILDSFYIKNSNSSIIMLYQNQVKNKLCTNKRNILHLRAACFEMRSIQNSERYINKNLSYCTESINVYRPTVTQVE
jgi:hypothetical protein